MNISERFYFETTACEFEFGMMDIVSTFAKREWGTSAVKFSTERQDHYEGTDLFVLRVPIDITLAFDNKDETRKLGALSLDGVTVDFGVRMGNSKAKFKTPVLVIGAGTAIGITKTNMWVVLDTIKANIHSILNTGMDKYFFATGA